MWADDFVYFFAYALSGLVPLFSPFFFVLLEYYVLELHHLSPHSITLVAIFIHLCEMYVFVRPLVHLFRRFHKLHSSRKSTPLLRSYDFQHRTKGPSVFIPTLSPGMWDRWWEDWVIMKQMSRTDWSYQLWRRWAAAPSRRRSLICSGLTTLFYRGFSS
jgi:hypothetical protein